MVKGYESLLIEFIHNRIHKLNKNYIACFEGEPGSGKSLSAISLASSLDEDFQVEQIAFTPLEFVKLIKKFDNPQNKGRFIVYEEAGVTADNRTWQTPINRFLAYIAQTFRYTNLGVIFTVPHFGFIDKKLRLLLQALVWMRTIDYKKNVAYADYNVVKVDKFGNWYLEHFIARPRGGRPLELNPVGFALPDHDLVEEYEERKQAFTGRLWDEAETVFSGENGNRIHHATLKKMQRKCEILDKILISWSEQRNVARAARMLGLREDDLQVLAREAKQKHAKHAEHKAQTIPSI